MSIKYRSSVIFVQDVERSKHFYTEILGQTIVEDYGRYIGFEGGFGIWEADYGLSIIFPNQKKSPNPEYPQTELFFETEDLDSTVGKLKSDHVSLIHEIHEHDWGQRGIRIKDPDGIIIEISEPISIVIQRFLQQGMTIEEVAEKTGMSLSEIERFR